jgi:tRNA pseudouridine-54 N-methylase
MSRNMIFSIFLAVGMRDESHVYVLMHGATPSGRSVAVRAVGSGHR